MRSKSDRIFLVQHAQSPHTVWRRIRPRLGESVQYRIGGEIVVRMVTSNEGRLDRNAKFLLDLLYYSIRIRNEKDDGGSFGAYDQRGDT